MSGVPGEKLPDIVMRTGKDKRQTVVSHHIENTPPNASSRFPKTAAQLRKAQPRCFLTGFVIIDHGRYGGFDALFNVGIEFLEDPQEGWSVDNFHGYKRSRYVLADLADLNFLPPGS